MDVVASVGPAATLLTELLSPWFWTHLVRGFAQLRGYDHEANMQGRCLLGAASHEIEAAVALEQVRGLLSVLTACSFFSVTYPTGTDRQQTDRHTDNRQTDTPKNRQTDARGESEYARTRKSVFRPTLPCVRTRVFALGFDETRGNSFSYLLLLLLLLLLVLLILILFCPIRDNSLGLVDE